MTTKKTSKPKPKPKVKAAPKVKAKAVPETKADGVIEISVVLDDVVLTIGDYATLDAASRGEAHLADVIAVLDKVVVGGVAHLPGDILEDVAAEVGRQLEELLAGDSATGN